MAKECDNTSVGVIIERDDKIALLKRAKFPIGIAPPAGHIDEHGNPEQAAVNEVREELGLIIAISGLQRTAITNRRVDNICRRSGGDHHNWWVYTTSQAEGELAPSIEETKGAAWYNISVVQALADRTQAFEREELTPDEWEQNPGLEPVWRDFFHELGYVEL